MTALDIYRSRIVFRQGPIIVSDLTTHSVVWTETRGGYRIISRWRDGYRACVSACLCASRQLREKLLRDKERR